MYHHKSGALKRKERKRRLEKEKLKKKEGIKQYFKKPEPKQDDVEENLSTEADMEEENSCTNRSLSTELTEHEKDDCNQQGLNMGTQKSLQEQAPNLDMQRRMEIETEKFALLLERLLAATLFFASQNLPFGERSEETGDLDRGHLLALLELLSQYDPVLQEHFETVKHSEETGERIQDHYLSPVTQGEFINLCGKHILGTISAERQKAIYFSVICDTISDVTMTSQRVVLVRYVHRNPETELWGIQERFIEHYDRYVKSSDEGAEVLLSKLNEHGIDMKDCRGQAYYNGSNMFNKIKGVSDCVEEKYPAAIFCPSAASSMNLVGMHAVYCSEDFGTLLWSVNRLFEVFSSNPETWRILEEETGCSLPSVSDNMWSARIEAVRPVAEKLPDVLEALYRLTDGRPIPGVSYYLVESVTDYFLSFRSVLLIIFWAKILHSFEEHNKILQNKSISLEAGAVSIKAISADMQSLREKWEEVFSEAELVADNLEIPKDLKPLYGNLRKAQHADHEVDAKTAFKEKVFLVVLDSIIAELKQYYQSMENISSLFAPILKLRLMSEEELVTTTEALVSKYPLDLTPFLLDELKFLRKVYDAKFKKNLEPLELLNAIYRLQIEPCFSEVCIALRIFIALPLSVVEGEYVSTKQALVKNYLCLAISEQQMDGLALLSSENELARKLDFKDLIQEYASAKIRTTWSTIF